MTKYSSVAALAVLLMGFFIPIQSASAATKSITPTTLTTCTVGGVTTVVASGTTTCSDGSGANVWTSTAGLVTADRPYLGTLRYCINNSTAVITTLSDGSASITCKSTESQVTWTRTWGVPSAPVIRNVSATSATTAMVAYSDSTANNGSQIVKYVVSSIPAASTAIHLGAGSPTMKISGLSPDTEYAFKVCATNAAGTTCSTTSPTIHTYPLAPAFTLNPKFETGVYGTAITGYTITQTGGNSTYYPTTYSISPAIPNGFTFSTTTGLLTGTPTGTQPAIVYTVTGTNISGTGSATFTLDVIKANQTITFPAVVGTKTYGDSNFTISASASSGLPVSFASTTPTVCSVASSTVSILGAGNCSITASQTGNANYNAAADVSQTFSIAKKDQTIDFAALSDVTYGSPSFNVSATATSGLDVTFGASGFCSLTGNSVSINGAGSCAVTASQAGNANYNPAVDVVRSFLIAKANQSINFAALSDKTYGDAAFDVSATSTAGLDVTFSATGACSIVGSTVTITGAGNCTVTASQGGSANYNAADDVVRTFAIAKAAQTVNFAPLSGKTYGNASFDLSASATSGLVVTFTASGACTVVGTTVTITGAGTCTITASQAGNENYNAANDVVQSFTVAQLAITVTANDASKVYGDADPSSFGYSAPGLIGSDTLAGSLSRAVGENVGTYSITGTLSNGNYIVTVVPGTFTITARAITVTADNASKVYGDTDPALTYSVTSGSLVGSDTLSGSLSRATGENVATYAISGTLSNSNYDITFVNGTFSITPKAITVTAANGSKVYGDADPASFGYSAPGLVGSDTLAGALARTPGEDAGTYIITGTLSNGNYNITLVDGTFTITPKAITVTANNASKVYGDSDPASFGYSAPGLVGSDTLSGSLSRTAGEDAGTYTISGSLSNGNYDITLVDGTFTITPKAVTVTANNASKVYGDSDPSSFGYSAPGLVGSDLLTGSLTRVAGENVGHYAITGTLSNGNYAVTFVGGTFTISAKAITVTATDASKVYGASDPVSFGYSAPGLVGSDTLSGSLSRAAGENAGTYAITGTLSNSNYSVTVVGGTFTITPKAITVTANNATKVYGTADPAFTYTITPGSLINSDVLSGSLTRTAGENVGTYPISGVLTNSNYQVTVVPGVFTITQATVAISFDCTFGGASIQTFDGKEFKFCRVNSGLVDGTVNYVSGNTNIFTVSGNGSGPIGHPVAVGIATLTVTFTPTDSLNYVSGESLTLTVHLVSAYSPNGGNDYSWKGYQAL